MRSHFAAKQNCTALLQSIKLLVIITGVVAFVHLSNLQESYYTRAQFPTLTKTKTQQIFFLNSKQLFKTLQMKTSSVISSFWEGRGCVLWAKGVSSSTWTHAYITPLPLKECHHRNFTLYLYIKLYSRYIFMVQLQAPVRTSSLHSLPQFVPAPQSCPLACAEIDDWADQRGQAGCGILWGYFYWDNFLTNLASHLCKIECRGDSRNAMPRVELGAFLTAAVIK